MVINLKNKLCILLIIIILIGLGVYLFFNTKNNNNNNYTTSKTSTDKQNNINMNSNNNGANTIDKKTTEELITTFSTKIYDKTASRQNNVSITCNTLNDTIIVKGSTFSFCDTVGQATTERGYQKADIFDKYGNKKKGLGGGNCQVSTTLYNAVLQIPSLVILERHEHSNKVPYIQTGLDAAVAYGSYDFKFRNDCDFDIKIKAENTPDAINISLYKIS